MATKMPFVGRGWPRTSLPIRPGRPRRGGAREARRLPPRLPRQVDSTLYARDTRGM